ncbi:MAG: DUF4397 domain-containing protein [Pseudopedobacter saltans]|uniref:DUF4397 domain-containing protein n=1 Tax=Pseudopedobacter saltans TaxID=151895 RepID=A0A2W5EC52_9SPHI|nr:MAG: DUF4397 domain-containing protein [Pseudopedobacter saltans]
MTIKRKRCGLVLLLYLNRKFLNSRIYFRMKKRYLIIGFFSILTLIVEMSCTKNELRSSPFDLVSGSALLKINYSCPYMASSQGVMVKINGMVYSSLITYSTPYPGGGLNTGGNSYADYLRVTPGIDTLSLLLPIPGTSIPDKVLYTTTFEVQSDRYQTIHVTDTATNIKYVMTNDLETRPDSGYVLYRFVNLIPNSQGIDLYFDTAKINRKLLASNIGYLQQSDTFRLPAGTSLPWAIQMSGKDSVLATYSTASSVANQRVFTVYARGYLGLKSTDTRSNKISFVYNK